jgi:transcription factor IIIB subunit 2
VWLYGQAGRSPAGICGAGLLIAARVHNFRRTQREVVGVVRVCDETLRYRLREFERTPSGRQTLQQFNSMEMVRHAAGSLLGV